MKAFWQNLNERERRAVSVMIVVVGLAVFYWLIWQPLHGARAYWQQQIQQQSALLGWMQQVYPQFHGEQPKVVAAQGILSVVENTFRQAELVPQILEQSANGQAIIQWKHVNFDALARVLLDFSKKYGINVVGADFYQLDNEGNVRGRLVLESSRKS